MEKQLTLNEIEQTLKVARIIAVGLTPEQFQVLVEAQEHLKEEGFLEGAWATAKLHREEGISYCEIAPALQQLSQQKEQIESEIEKLSAKKEGLESIIHSFEETLRSINKNTRQARQELVAIQSQKDKAARELETFRQEAKQEKERIQKEVEACREQAGVTRSETQTAAELKAELQKQDISLEVALIICIEFGKAEKPREKLMAGIQQRGSLQKYLKALQEWGESQKQACQSQIQRLQNDCQRLDSYLAQQQVRYNQGELLLQQQNQQFQDNEAILSFYHQYSYLQGLIAYLGNFVAVGFYACTWCGARYWILNPGKTSHSRHCLWCGLPYSAWDTEAYRALGMEPGCYQLTPRGGK